MHGNLDIIYGIPQGHSAWLLLIIKTTVYLPKKTNYHGKDTKSKQKNHSPSTSTIVRILPPKKFNERTKCSWPCEQWNPILLQEKTGHDKPYTVAGKNLQKLFVSWHGKPYTGAWKNLQKLLVSWRVEW